ncbi:ribose transport system permease protein/erythritol transport system permease protein [Okibacterium sp. HSC-33S16]|uniref:ABC transporter permease n=1 Tax=Okibacterium sp. HSC-33S16 TaxID=2910965 RepID=UPI00209DEA45|nr:ABC transporter permease [Okibacterium sp. HSC-33S16]MCP2032821.1 ribose transport system permease protein/erythritol transport system permease protein [Okibacterium sp. HSC-33S16]
MSGLTTQTVPRVKSQGQKRSIVGRALEALLTQRVVLLAVLIVLVVAVMTVLDAAGALSGSYNSDYLAAALINAVPLAMLGLAQLGVILSGRGGIDLSVGSMVSVTGIAFGMSYGLWGWSLPVAMIFAVVLGGVLGGINGGLVAFVGFPPLIATLATFYAYRSIALVWSGQKPVNSTEIQSFYSAAKAIELPVIGSYLPLVPLGIFTFLIPVVIVVWVLLNKTTFGRRIYALGTNDTAASWAGINVRPNRFAVYVLSGVISGLVGVVTVAQFASARPDAGTSGNGMALPAITIAVLGGVAITGGIGRVSGVVLATILIVWLNAGILLAFPGNDGVQVQLLALGLVLVFASLLNGLTKRKYGGI